MRWSFRVFRVGETEVRIHGTLLLLAAWYAWTGWRGAGPTGAAEQVVFVFLLFLSVLLHEFGHIVAARRYGIGTPEILLSPIGGIARIARMPEKPRQELVVALAGPAVTLAIIVVGLAVWTLLAPKGTDFLAAVDAGDLGPTVILTNGALLAFNLLPAFPMDGGRVVRALIASRWGYLRGTQIAARTGQLVAVGFIILGLRGNLILVLIGIFVLSTAEAEYRSVRLRAARDEAMARYVARPADGTGAEPTDLPPA